MNPSRATHSRIQRTFRDLSEEDAADVERALILARMGWSGVFGWDKLLESQRVLIISEAGAGKTYECRTQQQEMWIKGEPAFYLDLAQLATNNLRDLLSVEEEERLDAWRTDQSGVATFFLDSIDELKLTRGSFENALNRLGKAVSGQLARVRVVITSRPVAIDQQAVRRYLSLPDPVDPPPTGDEFADIAMGRRRKDPSDDDRNRVPVWRNVTLMPFSDDQIRDMAACQGVADTDALLAEIRSRHAEDFARRPQDLIELCSDWREHCRIRAHRDQITDDVRVKLKPRTDRQELAQLSPEKAREGACRLALAALLTRKLSIRLSTEADRDGKLGTALDPALVLQDWTADERATLLQRALFGFASYGRVRFQHRSVIEFLAAQRLEDRLDHGMPLKALKRLLFADTAQRLKIVKPTMRPVAAWLAATCPAIFHEVCLREPNVLLDYGDPEMLPLAQRAETLRAYAEHYGRGGWRGLQVPKIQVQRIASGELTDCVLSIWRTGVENDEVRELLLDLMGAGAMTACTEIPHRVAFDNSRSPSERIHAIDALVSLDGRRVEAITQSMMEDPKLWPDDVVRSALVRLFPRHITPARLCKILSRVKESGRTVGGLDWFLPRSIDEFEPDTNYLEQLRIGLTGLVTEDLAWRKEWPHLVSRRCTLCPALAATCLKLIQSGEATAEILRSSVIALRLADQQTHVNSESLQALIAVINEFDARQRQSFFWADDAFNQSLHPLADPWERLFRTVYQGPLKFSEARDGVWIRHVLADRGRQFVERAMMLEASMRVVSDGVGDYRVWVEGLKQHVVDDPRLVAMVDRQLVPREIDPEQAKLEAKLERRRIASESREAKHHADWAAFWREVGQHPETAFATGKEDNTTWNLWVAMRRSGDESRASGWSRRFIERHFGKEVADRVRGSLMPVWRRDRPTLRHERKESERTKIFVRWQLGLAAIYAEAEDPAWARNITAEEAELAARYAPIELNGFPAWLDALACERPQQVERTLGPELTDDLDEVATPGSFAVSLQNLTGASNRVVGLFLPRLRKWIDSYDGHLRDGESDSVAIDKLARALETLVDHGDEGTRRHLRDVAEHRLYAAIDGPFAPVWLTTIMRLDPSSGVSAFEHMLTAFGPDGTRTAVNLLGTMFGEQRCGLRVDLGNPGFTPELLLRLARLAYQHVHPSTDVEHEGAYSPSARDHAEEGRGLILKAIIEAKGAEAWAVKVRMTNDPLFAHFRDRLALLAYEKAAEEADDAALEESDLVTLDSYGEAPPASRDEMFSLLVDRLDDIKDSLLLDTSPRAAWAGITDEKVMRQQIARELQLAGRGIYTVDQEAVTSDEKETDIRLRVPASGQQAVIELKMGEKWSGRELRDAIKDQLVTRYMAAETCRSGCLLVTVVDAERTWKHPDTGDQVNIDGLRNLLGTEIAKIAEEMAGSLRLVVIVLDLRPRLLAGF